jgi:hypothetical protein
VLYYTDNKYKEYKMLFIGISVTIITICVIIFAASFYKTYQEENEELQKNLDKQNLLQNKYTIRYRGKDYEFVKERIFEIGNDGNRTEEIFDKKLI